MLVTAAKRKIKGPLRAMPSPRELAHELQNCKERHLPVMVERPEVPEICDESKQLVGQAEVPVSAQKDGVLIQDPANASLSTKLRVSADDALVPRAWFRTQGI